MGEDDSEEEKYSIVIPAARRFLRKNSRRMEDNVITAWSRMELSEEDWSNNRKFLFHY